MRTGWPTSSAMTATRSAFTSFLCVSMLHTLWNADPYLIIIEHIRPVLKGPGSMGCSTSTDAFLSGSVHIADWQVFCLSGAAVISWVQFPVIENLVLLTCKIACGVQAGRVPFHILGLKCPHCASYNTRRLAIDREGPAPQAGHASS